MDLKGKNILFISPEFFGIDHSIILELEERGANVTWFDERSIKSSFGRALNSISSIFFLVHSYCYYKKRLESIKHTVDVVLVIKGEMISDKIMKMIRGRWPSAHIILYLYDPVENINGIINKIHLYDRVISFEPVDCKKYNFEFRPLFCDFSNDNANDGAPNHEYDVCFYGTMYGDRFEVIYNIKNFCKEHRLNFYSFCFLRGKFMSIYYYFTNAGYRKLGLNSISYVPKTSVELMDIVKKTNIILDINDRKQQGLTIRTLETLLAGKKMITTNKDIVNYDFYNRNNICVVDRKNITIPISFFDNEYENIDQKILYKYTVKGWIDDVFGK